MVVLSADEYRQSEIKTAASSVVVCALDSTVGIAAAPEPAAAALPGDHACGLGTGRAV